MSGQDRTTDVPAPEPKQRTSDAETLCDQVLGGRPRSRPRKATEWLHSTDKTARTPSPNLPRPQPTQATASGRPARTGRPTSPHPSQNSGRLTRKHYAIKYLEEGHGVAQGRPPSSYTQRDRKSVVQGKSGDRGGRRN